MSVLRSRGKVESEAMLNYFDRDEWSRSDIETFDKSRRLSHATKVTKSIKDELESDALTIGTLTHQQLLEPHIESLIRVPPSHVLTKAGARSGGNYEAWIAENPGVISLKQSDYDIAMRAVRSLQHELSGLLKNFDNSREEELYWTDEETGIPLRAKLDLIVKTPEKWFITDIKTALSFDKFVGDVKFRLWLQHAHYRAAVKAVHGIDAAFSFCVVEKSGLYEVAHFELDDEFTAEADRKYREILVQIAECYRTGDWSNERDKGTVKVAMPWGFTKKGSNVNSLSYETQDA